MSDGKEKSSNGNGTSTAPVYLRLQKRAQAESRRAAPTREQARMRSLSLTYLVLLCCSCALWFLVQYVNTDERFHLHSVELSGGKFVARDAVEQVFNADRNVSIYRIPLENRRLQLEQIPWVRTAAITRVLPDRIAVTVEEREPIAFLWTRQGIELMDRDGVILESPSEVSWTFPVVRGIPANEAPVGRKERMQLYLQLMDGLRLEDGSYPAEISEVDLGDAENLSAVVADGTGAIRLHLGDENLKERYEIYRRHIAEWRLQFSEIHSIDLRFDGQAVIQSGSPYTVSVESEPGARPATALPPSSSAALKPLAP